MFTDQILYYMDRFSVPADVMPNIIPMFCRNRKFICRLWSSNNIIQNEQHLRHTFYVNAVLLQWYKKCFNLSNIPGHAALMAAQVAGPCGSLDFGGSDGMLF